MKKLNSITIIFILLFVIALGSILTIIYTTKENTNSINIKQPTTQTNSNTASIPNLEVISKEDKFINEYDYAIIGEVKNNTNHIMNNVFIRINLYDKDNKLIGDTVDRIDILDANEIWKFKAPILHEYQKEFKSYRIVELTGY